MFARESEKKTEKLKEVNELKQKESVWVNLRFKSVKTTIGVTKRLVNYPLFA